MGKLSSAISFLLFGSCSLSLWGGKGENTKMFIKMQSAVFQSEGQRWRWFDYMQQVLLAYFSSAFGIGLHFSLSSFNYAHKVESFSELYKATSLQYSLFICIFFILTVNSGNNNLSS